MANELRDARDGLASLLSGIAGLRVLDQPPESVSELPAAVIMLESRDAALTLGSKSFTGRIKVVLLVASADRQEACDTLDQFMDPLGASSIEAAVAADPTWNGAVDDGRLVGIENIGPRKLWGGHYIGADFRFRFVKQAG